MMSLLPDVTFCVFIGTLRECPSSSSWEGFERTDTNSTQAPLRVTIGQAVGDWAGQSRLWRGLVPVRDQLRLIAEFCADPLVIIDDFQVPGDSGYKFDDYGDLRALTLDFLHDILRSHAYRTFFPTMPSTEETGMRRGCVVLGRTQWAVDALEQLPLLKQAQPSVATSDAGETHIVGETS